MLCISIKPETEKELVQDFALACPKCDLVEIRLGNFADIPMDLLKECVQKKRVLLTSGQMTAEICMQLAHIGPAYLDISSDMPKKLFSDIRTRYPSVQLIVSHHNYEETPCDLAAIFQQLKSYPAHLSKCVTQAQNGLDALRMLTAVKEQRAPVIGFCMGDVGAFSRILAPIYGSKISYTCLPGKPTAPGQCTSLPKPSSNVYALVGKPVEHSLSHVTHNAVFQKNKIDAVYVKIAIDTEEVEEAVEHFVKLGFKGLSVTMPLKAYFGANTVRFSGANWTLCDTDGIGMLDAIEAKRKVAGKTILLLGAGSTAASIAKEALYRGAKVTISNRSKAKALQLGELFGCQVCPWKEAVSYDILINATCIWDEQFFDDIPQNALVADVISTKETALLQLAKEKGCERVSGHEMWLKQAAYQFAFWENLDPQKVQEDFQEELSCV